MFRKFASFLFLLAVFSSCGQDSSPPPAAGTVAPPSASERETTAADLPVINGSYVSPTGTLKILKNGQFLLSATREVISTPARGGTPTTTQCNSEYHGTLKTQTGPTAERTLRIHFEKSRSIPPSDITSEASAVSTSFSGACQALDNYLLALPELRSKYRIERGVLWISNDPLSFSDADGNQITAPQTDPLHDFFAKKDMQIDASADLSVILSGDFQQVGARSADMPSGSETVRFDWGFQDFTLQQSTCAFSIGSEKSYVNYLNGEFTLTTNGPQPLLKHKKKADTKGPPDFESSECKTARESWMKIASGTGRKFTIQSSPRNVDLAFDGDPAGLIYRGAGVTSAFRKP